MARVFVTGAAHLGDIAPFIPDASRLNLGLRSWERHGGLHPGPHVAKLALGTSPLAWSLRHS
jgi:hypothetical protein